MHTYTYFISATQSKHKISTYKNNKNNGAMAKRRAVPLKRSQVKDYKIQIKLTVSNVDPDIKLKQNT